MPNVINMNVRLPYVNFHTHLPLVSAGDVISVVSLMAGTGELVARPEYCTVGIHPWQLTETGLEALQRQLLDDLHRLRPVAIGEAGLDRAIAVPLALQQHALSWQQELALELGLPMVIHSVRAFDLLLSKPKKNITSVIHGFSGKPPTAIQLLRAGFYLSFGKAIFDKKSNAAASVKMMPPERLFLETDTSEIDIAEIYRWAAMLRGETEESLRDSIFRNFVRLFNSK